jgi:hypothetical protein
MTKGGSTGNLATMCALEGLKSLFCPPRMNTASFKSFLKKEYDDSFRYQRERLPGFVVPALFHFLIPLRGILIEASKL